MNCTVLGSNSFKTFWEENHSSLWSGILFILGTVVAVVLAISLAIGVAPFVLSILLIATVSAFYIPIIIPIMPLILSPLLGRTGDSTIGPLDSMAILGLWLLSFGGTVAILNFKIFLKEKIFFLSLMIILVSLISTIFSKSKIESIIEIIRICSSFTMIMINYILCKKLKYRTFIFFSILISSIIPLVIGIYQSITGNVDYGPSITSYEIRSGIIRIYSTFWDNHPFAKYLMIVLSLLFPCLIIMKHGYLKQIMLVLIFFVALIELFLTYARSEVIGFMISVFAILYATNKLRIKVIIPTLFVLIIVFFATGMFERFSDVFQPLNLDSASRENSLKARLLVWGIGFPLAMQRPFFGHGLATFKDAADIVAHNDYLGLFYEIGIGGPILYILFLYSIGKKSLKIWYDDKIIGSSWIDRSMILAVFSATCAIIIVSFVENLFRATAMWWPYFAMLGCIMAAYEEKKNINYEY